ncbi:MAG: sodium-dependent transporter [Zoogloeaceae bacterium]|jgi:NSS family neurotransmitter:Na+ symporter|nr:sodium-dependent transporter [Zoogloeaceae bacterium]
MSAFSSSPRSSWSNRWAYIMVTVGSSVGLGNIWRFPYMTGSQGGSAFVLVYLVCVLLVGIPVLMAETLIGRRGRGNPVSSMLNVSEESGRSPWWAALGWTGMIGALLILSYYSVVSGWIVNYVWKFLTGFTVLSVGEAKSGFEDLLADPLSLAFCHSVFVALTIAVVARGVVSGIERANRVLMPALFLILILLAVWGGVTGDIAGAAHFMFDFSPEKLTGDVILSALGHAFFSLSLGMGAIMAYGSYLRRETSIFTTSLWVVAAGVLVGLFAGLAIFALTFGFGIQPTEGAGLILKTLPLTFAHMPGGRIFGLFFFLLVLFAAWTSAISLLEPFVSWLTERMGWRRPLSAWVSGAFSWAVGLLVCLSFNRWENARVFGKNFFEILEFSTSCIAMPLTGLAIAVFVGWRMREAFVREEIALSPKVFALWYGVLRYFVPLAIGIVFVRESGFLGW